MLLKEDEGKIRNNGFEMKKIIAKSQYWGRGCTKFMAEYRWPPLVCSEWLYSPKSRLSPFVLVYFRCLTAMLKGLFPHVLEQNYPPPQQQSRKESLGSFQYRSFELSFYFNFLLNSSSKSTSLYLRILFSLILLSDQQTDLTLKCSLWVKAYTHLQ